MKVGVVTQWYPPENVWVPHAVVEALTSAGHDVRVVTGVPHYPSGKVEPGYSPTRFHSEVVDGVMVFRVPEYPYRGSSALGRLIGYVSFALSACVAAMRHLRGSDALVVYASPATAALPAMILRAIFKKPYVLQVQDVWPDSVVNSGFIRNSFFVRSVHAMLNNFVNWSYRLAAQIVVITDSAQTLLIARGVPEEKLDVIYNWTSDPREDYRSSAPGDSIRDVIGASDNQMVFIYAGTIGPAQDLQTVVTAFQAAEISHQSRLVIIGDGVEFPKLAALAERVPGVHVLRGVPIATAANWSMECDVGIVSLSDTALHRATFPSKIQFLCGLGVPLLARAPGDVSRFVTKSRAGVGVTDDAPDSLIEAFRTLAEIGRGGKSLTEMGNAARSVFDEKFHMRVGTSLLDEALTRAAGCAATPYADGARATGPDSQESPSP